MASTPRPPHEDELRALDWQALRASAHRRLRARMSGFSSQDLEDAVQDVAERMVEFVRRRGRPDAPEGLLVSIVRGVAADAIARRQRDRTIHVPDDGNRLEQFAADPEEDDVLEEYRRIVFHVREYFRLKRAGCVPLAEAKSRGESLKTYAEREGVSYDQVRQAWSRCVKLIHDAIHRNRLQLMWQVPSERKPPDA